MGEHGLLEGGLEIVMECLLPASLRAPPQVRPSPPPTLLGLPPSSTKLQSIKALYFLRYCLPKPRLPPSSPSRSAATDLAAPSSATHWLVVVDAPPNAENSSKAHIIDHYVKILASVLGNEKDAQMCIYSASWDTHFGFCCDIDEDSAKQLAGLFGVRSVKPDPDVESVHKDYSLSNNSVQGLLNPNASLGELKYWIVRMARPGVQVVTKAQIVDHYAQTLTKVLGNENDAQASIYHVSWQKNYGFCCVIEEECARELLDVPGVLSVHPDTNPESEVKNYEGDGLSGLQDSPDTINIKTKRLFVTGLSFYTSEKTLRAAFEGFGELVEVKIIMDKISKRSKGYAFLEYTTEEAAGAALKEMNGKIINGWMIVVDVAKKNPPPRSNNRYNPRKAF